MLWDASSPAHRYHLWLQQVQRAPAFTLEAARPLPELELQARWFAGEFGRHFRTRDGQEVEIVHFGRWNPECGPTFIEVQLRIGEGEPLTGAVEVQAEPAQWLRHAAEAPEYEATLLYFSAGGGLLGGNAAPFPIKTRSGRPLPHLLLDGASFEFGSRLTETPPAPATPPVSLAPDRLAALLEAAAQYRTYRKAARLHQASERFGPREALYAALAETLGYRRNQLPFRLLTQRFPFLTLRRTPDEIEARLFAGAGFLSATELAVLPGETRTYLREIWQKWWPIRSEVDRLTLPGDFWEMRGLRPVNHPHRRVAALAILVANWAILEELALRGEMEALESFFSRLRHPYWDYHFTLTSARSNRRMALIGPTRVADMLSNLFFPAALLRRPALWEVYRQSPARGSNQRVEETVRRLFGELPATWLKRSLFQQGVLQLDDDGPFPPEAWAAWASTQ